MACGDDDDREMSALPVVRKIIMAELMPSIARPITMLCGCATGLTSLLAFGGLTSLLAFGARVCGATTLGGLAAGAGG